MTSIDEKSPFVYEANTYRDRRVAHWEDIHTRQQASLGNHYWEKLTDCYRNLIPEGSLVLEIGCGEGRLLSALKPAVGVGIDFSQRAIEQARVAFPELSFYVGDAHGLDLDEQYFDFIVLSDLLNDLWDVQAVLQEIRRYCGEQTRLVLNVHSHLWNAPLSLAQQLGLARKKLPQNWLTRHDVFNLLEISGFQVLRAWEEVLIPIYVPLLSTFGNRYVVKLWPFRWGAIANFVVARSHNVHSKLCPSVSIVIAARNEEGHISELIERIPQMGSGTEIIFVEGNSSDLTYDAIFKVIADRPHLNCQLIKQTGKGKGDAVRAGFDIASGDVLMILDADITVPPEDLPRFLAPLANGSAEFVNGVRLVYPMESGAMRFANLVGNKFFSWAFSWLLGQPIRDSLCGTKVLWRRDYLRIASNRKYFGDFDPFGDFDLLFGAARLNLKILEVPIRYRARRYGETNISRWRHGVLLLRMVWFAARRIKFV